MSAMASLTGCMNRCWKTRWTSASSCYPRRLPGLAVDPFRHERLVLVCHPQHPLANRTTVTVPDLKGCPFVAWNEIRWSPFLRNVPELPAPPV